MFQYQLLTPSYMNNQGSFHKTRMSVFRHTLNNIILLNVVDTRRNYTHIFIRFTFRICMFLLSLCNCYLLHCLVTIYVLYRQAGRQAGTQAGSQLWFTSTVTTSRMYSVCKCMKANANVWKRMQMYESVCKFQKKNFLNTHNFRVSNPTYRRQSLTNALLAY